MAKQCKSESATADPEEVGYTYGIDHIKDVSPPGFQKTTFGTKSRRTHGLF